MIAQQQLVDRLHTAIFIGHVVLNAEDAGHTSPAVTTVHGDRHLVMTKESLVLGIADHGDDGTVLPALTNLEDGGAQPLEIVAVEELREINWIIALFHRTLFREEEIMTGSRQILPDAQASCL